MRECDRRVLIFFTHLVVVQPSSASSLKLSESKLKVAPVGQTRLPETFSVAPSRTCRDLNSPVAFIACGPME